MIDTEQDRVGNKAHGTPLGTTFHVLGQPMDRHPTDVNRLGLGDWASPNREVARNPMAGAPSNPELGGLCLKRRVTILFLRRSGDGWSRALPATLPAKPTVLPGKQ